MNTDCSVEDEVAYFSDGIDSDIEAELYGQLHHERNSDPDERVPRAFSSVPDEQIENARDASFVRETNRQFISVALENRAAERKRRSTYKFNFNSYSEAERHKTENLGYDWNNNRKRVNTFAQRCGKKMRLLPQLIDISDSPPPSSLKRRGTLASTLPADSSEEGFDRHNIVFTEAIRKTKLIPELIDISDSPQRFDAASKSTPGRHIIHKIRKCESTMTKSRERVRKNKICDSPEVITVIDSDDVYDVVISSQSDLTSESEDAISIQGAATDILLNLNESQDLDDMDLNEILRKMPGDPHLWKINEQDRFPTEYKRTYQYQENSRLLRVTCLNCRERGHMSRNCTKSRRLAVCYLCGTDGHQAADCSRPACVRCMTLGHRVGECHWKETFLKGKCTLCGMSGGHFAEECPDNWRKYHLTISAGPIVKTSNSSSNSKLPYCYNCGACGHLGHECRKSRMNKHIHPHLPWVVDYDGISNLPGKSKAKSKTYSTYAEKQKSNSISNERHLKGMSRKIAKKEKRLRKMNMKNLEQKRSFNVSVQNGQILYPRTIGLQAQLPTVHKFFQKMKRKMRWKEMQ